MQLRRILLILLPLLCLSAAGFAQDEDDADAAAEKALKAQKEAMIAALNAKVHLEHGTVTIGDGLATITLPDGYGYLSPEDAGIMLNALRGYPMTARTLGAIVPATVPIGSKTSFDVVITYLAEGHVGDENAGTLDPHALIDKMKAANEQHNVDLRRLGYQGIDLLGWAENPHYDPASHKLTWALETKLSKFTNHDFTYHSRALGRDGVLLLNSGGRIEKLPLLEGDMKKIVDAVNFAASHRYDDYNAATDRKASYGLAELISGPLPAAHKEPKTTAQSSAAAMHRIYLIFAVLLVAVVFLFLRIIRKRR